MIDIRPATEADKGQILARMQDVYGRIVARRAERLWHWQWQQDPRLPTPGYRGVVAVWDGQVIGNLATIPAGLVIGGQPVTAWWFVDVLVHWGMARAALRGQRGRRRSAHGGAGGGPDLSRGLAAALFDHPAAGPIQLGKHIGDQMAVIGDRLGFERLPGTGSQHRRVSAEQALERALGESLGALVAPLADLGIRLGPRPRLPVEVHTGPIDASFDALWQSVAGAWPAICRRDAALLNWRYLAHPDGGHQVLRLDDGGRLRGYCVVRAFDQGRRRRGKILDLLTAPADEDARRALLGAALRTLRRLGAERAECFHSDADTARLLRRFGFTEKTSRAGQPRPMMVRGLPAGVGGLFVMQGDGDGG